MRTTVILSGISALALLAACLCRPADGQAVPSAQTAGGSDALIAGVAGLQPNVNDHIWVVERAMVNGKSTCHLAVYRLQNGGPTGGELKLLDARQLDWDLRITQLSRANPPVAEVKRAVEKAEEDERKRENGQPKPEEKK